jgi:hypothetical protein
LALLQFDRVLGVSIKRFITRRAEVLLEFAAGKPEVSHSNVSQTYYFECFGGDTDGQAGEV